MALHRIKKGLDLPIAGEPEQRIDEAPQPAAVALLAADYVGMRPTMYVAPGDVVKRGQLLFEDKKTPGLRYTSPGAGTVAAVNRGDRRAFQSVVVELNERERAGAATEEDAVAFTGASENARGDALRALLIESGLWSAFRTRPFSKVPAPESKPYALFVTAMHSDPLAPSAGVVLQAREADFERGLVAIASLCEGTTYLCRAPGSAVPAPAGNAVSVEEFEGPHPAGTPGVHIHTLCPAHRDRTVWHVNYQDVAAIGRFLATGRLDVERIVSLAGPSVAQPRLLRTRLGARTADLVAGQLTGDDNRVVSGSVLSGRIAGDEVHGYLGRYAAQITVLPEGREREFLGWMAPGAEKFSTTRLFLSQLFKNKRFAFTTTTHGGQRAMVPIGQYERVMPMDILPTFLLRALLAGDVERAEELGCLELDEEDLALCTFVCPSKIDYGPALRDILDTIEKEG
ncbi:MAG: Na(+)-translocating NADH-quinone reductase subunit A [Candidatus Hydrogenedentes bacterium]|nr:Na(+)-translocating NADH-quinone reductase subunit A [Candidatus Hydrogenedentota bacterium]